MWGSGGAGGDSADWELSKENVQPLRQGRRVDVLSTSLQTSGDEETALKVAEQRRHFEMEIRTYTGEDPLAPWHQYVLWMEQHCPRGGHEGNLDGLLTQCIKLFSADTRYHQDPRFVSLIIKQALSTPHALETFMSMFKRHIGTKLTMFYRAWSAQLELACKMMRADTVLSEGERLGAEPADELAEARRKLQMRVASALAAGQLPAQDAPAAGTGGGRNAGGQTVEERHALGALRGSSDGVVPRQRVGPVQVGGPGVLPTAAHQPRGNQRLKVFVDENAPAAPAPASDTAAAPGGGTELPTGRAMHKENVRKAGPWGAPQKASKRPTPAAGAAAPAFRVYEDSGTGAATGSPITIKQGALATRTTPAPGPTAALDNIPVAHFEPPNEKVKVMYCKDLIYAGAGEVSLEELRAARWKKDNRLLLEQRRMHEEVQRQIALEQRRMHEEVQRQMQEVLRRNDELERQMRELRSRPAPQQQPAQQQNVLQQVSLHGSLGSSNVSGGSSSLHGHSNLSGSTVLASPTVNTRDAMNYVREMLNRTVDASVQLPPPRHTAGMAAPASIPFTVYEEPESSVFERPPPPPVTAATPFTVYEEPEPASAAGAPAPGSVQKAAGVAASAAPFSVYEDDACGAQGGEEDDDSDRENRPPADCPPPPPRRRPPNILVDAVDIPTEPLTEEPLPPPPAPASATNAPSHSRRPLQFDDELTGFVPISDEVTIAAGDLSQFAAAAGRVASTPLVAPQPPPTLTGARGGRREEEEGDFTANLKNMRLGRLGGDRAASERGRSEADGGALTPIMECSRERYKSSSSSSGSDMSRQSRCDVSAPGQQWRGHRVLPSAADRSNQLHQPSRAPLLPPPPPQQLTQSSGYLGDRSGSVRPASVAGGMVADCSMSRRPDSADASGLQAPDVSMAPPPVAGSPNGSTLRPAELSEKAAELSLAPELSGAMGHFSSSHHPAELSALQPPADVSALQPPTALSPAQPPAELSAFHPPAGLSPAQPPPEFSVLQEPAALSPAQPPVELSALQPPADLSDCQSPAAPVPPSAALSELTLNDQTATAPGEHPDPWDAALQTELLRSLQRPVHTRQRYRRVAGKLPNFARKETIELDGERVSVTLIGEGAYARAYHAIFERADGARCLKVQPEGGDWEFYVVDELHDRLAGDAAATAEEEEARPFLMRVERMFAFDNGSVLSSRYEPAGTLLDVYNKAKTMYGKFDEALALVFTAEMLGAVAAVHSAGFIHGDVKPDNFLLRAGELEHLDQLIAELRESEHPQLLQLIDFGRAIDMTLFPPGTTFTRVVTTDDFTCPEMKDGREWTYQTDLYGVVASAHVLLCGSYLKLTRRPAEGGPWCIGGTVRRFWSPVWAEFFSTFLNIGSCAELPDLREWRRRFLDTALRQKLDVPLQRLHVAVKQR